MQSHLIGYHVEEVVVDPSLGPNLTARHCASMGPVLPPPPTAGTTTTTTTTATTSVQEVDDKNRSRYQRAGNHGIFTTATGWEPTLCFTIKTEWQTTGKHRPKTPWPAQSRWSLLTLADGWRVKLGVPANLELTICRDVRSNSSGGAILGFSCVCVRVFFTLHS